MRNALTPWRMSQMASAIMPADLLKVYGM
jgi:hypothetical protein